MLSPPHLRWANAGIRHSRQSLMYNGLSARNFSINSSSSHIARPTRPLPFSRRSFAQQTRSLSLFGWGGSSKASTDSVPNAPADVQIGNSTSHLDNIRTIKASHATSDAPDPSQIHLHPPNQIEPQIIEDLQEKITLPHGAASDKIEEIISGATDISNAAERVGYLKEVCGLDFGWGPSAVMENLLEWFHVSVGLSWTASIIALAAILRVAMFPPIVSSQIEGKKMRDIQPVMAPLRARYSELMRSGDRARAAAVGAEMKEIHKMSGVSYTRAFVPLLLQIPFSFGAFRVLRNAGQLPVPAFVTEDWLWTTDLSYSDPYFITPAISSATIWLSFRLQSKQQNTMFGPQMMKIFGIGLPAISFVFMSFQPGAVQLYFLTTGLLAFATTSILRQQWFRNLFNLGPIPNALPPASNPTVPVEPQKALPSNIRRIPPREAPVPESAAIEEQADNTRSGLDKGIDKIKGGWGDLKKGFTDTKPYQDFVSRKEADRKTRSSAVYEAQRKREMEAERERRNSLARGNRT